MTPWAWLLLGAIFVSGLFFFAAVTDLLMAQQRDDDNDNT